MRKERTREIQISPNQQQKQNNKINNKKKGANCYSTAYFFGFGMSLLGVIVSLFIIPRSKYGLKDFSRMSADEAALVKQQRAQSSIAFA